MRYNIFNQIHKALRAMLYDTALILQQTDFNQPDETEPTLQRLKLVLDLFDQHAHHEDSVILPAIQEYEPSISDCFCQEHVEDHELAEKLRGLVEGFEKISDAQEQVKKGQAILHAFIGFMTFNLEHMGKEETILNDRLWRHYSDAEIVGLNEKILANVDPRVLGITSGWMMKAMSNSEITGWLKAVQRNAPEAVFSNLFSIAEKELPAQRFRQILENLTEGAMIA